MKRAVALVSTFVCSSIIVLVALRTVNLGKKRQDIDSSEKEVKTTSVALLAEQVRLLENVREDIKVRKPGKHRLPTGGELSRYHLEASLQSLTEAITLTPEEREKIFELYDEYQAIRTTFESQTVHVVARSGRTLTLAIPAYPEAGKLLRRMFLEDLASAFPNRNRFEDVDDHLGHILDQRFLGFGSFDQTLTIEKIDGKYRILRELRKSESAKKAPYIDPSFEGATATATLTAEQLRTGNFSSIADIVTGQLQ